MISYNDTKDYITSSPKGNNPVMKIKIKELPYEKVANLPRPRHRRPLRPNPVLKKVINVLANNDLKKLNYTEERIGMEKLKKHEPALVLMNHSSFIDLEIASKVLYPNSYEIVCTTDGFVGKGLLMTAIGCIPTQKFAMDLNLIKDMKYALTKLKTSVLLYPEAGYSFDGRTTMIPESLGKCIKMLGVPVVMITTFGAFHRDPLYNMLQLRKVDISARVEYVFSPEDTKEKSVDEINQTLCKLFSFDSFKWQQENKIKVDEPFRADGLNRVLFKCPHCMCGDKMKGHGIMLTCHNCGAEYELDEYGFLKNTKGETKFDSVTKWYDWERETVRKEIEDDEYLLDVPVDIYMLVDRRALYKVGDGNLKHDKTGFTLTGCNGKLNYTQKPSATYTLNADYYWYEIGDTICIGDIKTSYYCFPKCERDVVAKTRLATEELYKIFRKKRKAAKESNG